MRVQGIIAWLVSLLLATSHSPAQSKDDLSVLVTFGWQGRIPGHRWSPITVSISPGERALAGTVTAEYRQGAAGIMRASVPFAATPNTTTPVQIMVWFPELGPSVTISIRDDAGRLRWRTLYETFGRNNSPTMPFPLGASDPLIVVVGRTTLVEALRDWQPLFAASLMTGAPSNVLADEAWSKVVAAREDVETLPTSWIAYDGLTALIINPDSTRPPNPRAVEAIHNWVASGGRLIVRADEPGDAWRTWVPSQLADSVRLDAPTPAELPLATRAIERVAQRIRLVRESPDGGAAVPGTSVIPAAADRTIVRFIQPGPGWRAATPPGSGITHATARHGFGEITLLGFNPEKTTQTLSTTGSGAVWREVLWPAVEHDALQPGRNVGYRAWGVTTMSPSDAADALLNRVARVPGVGFGVFVLIAVTIAVLGLLVGPGDYLILKRLGLLQRSWATALLWISLASLGAFLGPRFLRTENSRINRISIEDTIIADPPLAFSSGITGLYSADGGAMKFPAADRASWWRGATMNRFGSSPASTDDWLGETRISQAAAGGDLGSIRGGPLLELPIATWTFRAFADDSARTPTLSARLSRESNGWSAIVTGLPNGVRVERTALRIRSGWVTQQREGRFRSAQTFMPSDVTGHTPHAPITISDGTWSAQFPDRHLDPDPPFAWANTSLTSSHYFDTSVPIDQRPAVPCQLHGPRRRGHAIGSLVDSGAWAAVHLEVSNWPADPAAEGVLEGAHSRILRLIAPLNPGEEHP
jgi:hypothetical protein